MPRFLSMGWISNHDSCEEFGRHAMIVRLVRDVGYSCSKTGTKICYKRDNHIKG